MSYKFSELIEIGFIWVGLMSAPAVSDVKVVPAQADQVPAVGQIASKEVNINTEGTDKVLANLTLIAAGITIVGGRIFELYKAKKKVDDESFQGKLSRCEEEKDGMRDEMKAMNETIDNLTQTIERLNKTIKGQNEMNLHNAAPVATVEVQTAPRSPDGDVKVLPAKPD